MAQMSRPRRQLRLQRECARHAPASWSIDLSIQSAGIRVLACAHSRLSAGRRGQRNGEAAAMEVNHAQA